MDLNLKNILSLLEDVNESNISYVDILCAVQTLESHLEFFKDYEKVSENAKSMVEKTDKAFNKARKYLSSNTLRMPAAIEGNLKRYLVAEGGLEKEVNSDEINNLCRRYDENLSKIDESADMKEAQFDIIFDILKKRHSLAQKLNFSNYFELAGSADIFDQSLLEKTKEAFESKIPEKLRSVSIEDYVKQNEGKGPKISKTLLFESLISFYESLLNVSIVRTDDCTFDKRFKTWIIRGQNGDRLSEVLFDCPKEEENSINCSFVSFLSSRHKSSNLQQGNVLVFSLAKDIQFSDNLNAAQARVVCHEFAHMIDLSMSGKNNFYDNMIYRRMQHEYEVASVLSESLLGNYLRGKAPEFLAYYNDFYDNFFTLVAYRTAIFSELDRLVHTDGYSSKAELKKAVIALFEKYPFVGVNFDSFIKFDHIFYSDTYAANYFCYSYADSLAIVKSNSEVVSYLKSFLIT